MRRIIETTSENDSGKGIAASTTKKAADQKRGINKATCGSSDLMGGADAGA